MRIAALMLSTLLLACVSGCGYRVGSLMHPQIRTIAVAPVVNETIAYNVSAEVRGLLCEAFMTDGSLKLVDTSKADCIVYARVLGVNFSEISWATKSNDFDVPNQWQVSLFIEYSVVIPGQAKPLLSARKASGSADFQTGADQEIGRRNGIRQAAYAAAKNVVAGVTEAW